MKFIKHFAFCIASLILFVSCKKDMADNNPVVPPGGNPVPVTSLTLNKDSLVLNIGTTAQIIATIVPSNATNKKVNWTSSNVAIASVDTTGRVTAVSGGAITITARSADNNSFIETVNVYVLQNVDIYIAGKGSSFNFNGGAYWVNGVPTILPDNFGHLSEPTAITVSGNDVYVGGMTFNQDGWSIATYWKNGVKRTLHNPLDEMTHYVTSIGVSGNNVYVGGWYWYYGPTTMIFHGLYYTDVNGTGQIDTTALYTTGTESRTYAMAISGSSIYVAGHYQTDNFFSIPKYWKTNFNNATSLTAGGSWGIATGIAVQGSDVFIAGFDGCPNFGCIPTATYWKNTMNTAINLTDGTLEAGTTGITVSGNDVYVAGYEKNAAGNEIAMMWKVSGSTVTSIPLTDGQYRSWASAIAVKGNDVFITGYEITPDGNEGKYWRFLGTTLIETVPLPWFETYNHTTPSAIYVK